MPGKSRHRRGKRPQIKKRKGGLSHPTVLAQQPAVAQTHESISRPFVSIPSTGVRTSVTKPVAVYPYIPKELRTIGILAGIMLIILIVLSRVLS